MVHEVTAAEVDGQLAVGGRLLEHLELDHHLGCVLGCCGAVLGGGGWLECLTGCRRLQALIPAAWGANRITEG